eukprot:TRINITY_DN24410_c0_g2_i1.p1 TRINITY_DN24410_c0_g2~~TRINITY_DN24410_c0_g2_i1.p1  ORF type:complete len:536 (+),score=104.97 TRINITY_DN24410_c0_g2_i1:62-1669(+)
MATQSSQPARGVCAHGQGAPRNATGVGAVPQAPSTGGGVVRPCRLLVVTWNVACAEPGAVDFDELTADAVSADFVAVCLQEAKVGKRNLLDDAQQRAADRFSRRVVGPLQRLTTAALNGPQGERETPSSKPPTCSPEKMSPWEAPLHAALRRRGDFEFLAHSKLVGLRLFVFVREALAGAVGDVFCGSIATGSARLGNKGAVAVAAELWGRRFAFVNSHLAAGSAMKAGAREDRTRDFRRILGRLALRSMDGAQSKRRLGHYPLVVWAGDMNSRLKISKSHVRHVLAKIQMGQTGCGELLYCDELATARRDKLELFHGFSEAQVSFAPTYKFVVGSTSEYDVGQVTSGKTRVPAWCDRVLYRGPVACHKYSSCPLLTQSDHKPVAALLEMKLPEMEAEVDGPLRRVCSNLSDCSDNEGGLLGGAGGASRGDLGAVEGEAEDRDPTSSSGEEDEEEAVVLRSPISYSNPPRLAQMAQRLQDSDLPPERGSGYPCGGCFGGISAAETPAAKASGPQALEASRGGGQLPRKARVPEPL